MYVEINGYAVPYEQVPCSKCDKRYAYVCPTCTWNLLGKHNTYQEVDPKDTLGIKDFKEAFKCQKKN